MSTPTEIAERPIGPVRGTRDWLPDDFSRLSELEARLIDRFARAGYAPIHTPVLESTELHERKSGAGIVSKLFELSDAHQARLCLRPELTASIVRAYADSPRPLPLPWRVSMSGPVFRFEKEPQPGHYREFQQVGVELLGASGPLADGEVIWLSHAALREVGLTEANLRIGHVGLILETLERSGLPPAARSALIESLSEAAAEGRNVRSLESALEQFAGWLEAAEAEAVAPLASDGEGDRQVDRLFRQLVPDVTGRRSGHEILGRLRRKWDLAHTLHGVIDRVRSQVRELADLRGPAAGVLDRLARDFKAVAPDSVASLRDLMRTLGDYGLPTDRVELDLGFGRGIGFYSQMVFEWTVPTPGGPVEVCGGGRYDGLARVLGSDRDDRGVGFACGLERLFHVLDARGAREAERPDRGCLVTSTSEFAGDALSLLADLRRFDSGRWHDGGPIVGINLVEDPGRLDEAKAYARSRGLAALVVVKNRRIHPEGLSWFTWDGQDWVEQASAPPILLARGSEESFRP